MAVFFPHIEFDKILLKVHLYATYLPMSGIESGNLSSKNWMRSFSVLMASNMSNGMNNVTTNVLSSLFGRAIIMKVFLAQMWR